jgi:hypothetical protein
MGGAGLLGGAREFEISARGGRGEWKRWKKKSG